MTKSATREAADKVTFTQTEVTSAIAAGDTAARAGRRNWIINGDNRISQRGTYTSALDFVHNQYHFDRWKSNKTGGSIDGTIVQSSATLNSAVCITQLYTVTTGSAGSYIGAHQKLEFPETFIGRTVTISAWVKSNTTTARLQIYNQASGGNATIAVDTHTGGGAWEYLTATGTVLAGTTALSLFVATLTEAAGTVTTVTGDYIEFTNVQLELGSVATDFEHRSYGEELALCQRYYYKVQTGVDGGYGYRGGNGSIYSFNSTAAFPVQMRTAPTTVVSGGTLDGCSAYSVNTTTDGYISRVSPDGTGRYRAYEQNITFSAEL